MKRRDFLKMIGIGAGATIGVGAAKTVGAFARTEPIKAKPEKLVIVAKESIESPYYYAPETKEGMRCIFCKEPVSFEDREQHTLHHIYKDALKIRQQAKRGKFSIAGERIEE